MKRLGLLLVVLLGTLFAGAPTAEAHPFRHFGHRHFGAGGAYRYWGGYRPLGWGWGAYRPWSGISLTVGLGPRYGWGYNPYFYDSFYYSSFSGGWPNYYYAAPYYYQPAYYNNTPAYYYPAGCYFGSAPSVYIDRVIVARSEDRRPAATEVPADTATLTRSRIDVLSRSRHLVRLGDAAFREGRHVDALARYRAAVETAPDNADAHFRKGHAYLASGKYDLAAAAFRQGLSIDAGALAGVKLDDLYGPDSPAKEVHTENLAAEALLHDGSADPYLLLGVLLYCDGQRARASKFFARSAELSPELLPTVARLLPAGREVPVSVAARDEI